MVRTVLTLGVLGAVFGCGGPETVWTVSGLGGPEAATYLAARDQFVVSNFAGYGAQSGKDGFLSLVDRSGELAELRWVEGFFDPKGSVVLGDELIVADISGLHVISVASGDRIRVIPLPGAVNPNDIVEAPDGALLVSDIGADTIFRVTDTAEVWLEGEITQPNGMALGEGQLFVGQFGSEARPGGVLAVDLETKAVTPVPGAQALGDIDGLVYADGALVIGSYSTGDIWTWQDGEATPFVEEGKGAADISLHDDLLLVPNLHKGTLTAYRLTLPNP